MVCSSSPAGNTESFTSLNQQRVKVVSRSTRFKSEHSSPGTEHLRKSTFSSVLAGIKQQRFQAGQFINEIRHQGPLPGACDAD